MAAVKINNMQWDVDDDGCAVTIVPGIPTATVTKVPCAMMDKRIARITEEKVRVTAARDACQAKLDEITQMETDMIALRATVDAEP